MLIPVVEGPVAGIQAHFGHIGAAIGPHAFASDETVPEMTFKSRQVGKQFEEIQKTMRLAEKLGPDTRKELLETTRAQAKEVNAQSVGLPFILQLLMKLVYSSAEESNDQHVTPEMAKMEGSIRTAMVNTPSEMRSFADISHQMMSGMRGPKANCFIDYNAPCPMGWNPKVIGGRTLCINQEYGGTCNNQLDLTGFSDEQKAAVARVCSTPFSCQGPCRHDYTLPCPMGWKEVGSTCTAGPDYTGPCSKEIDMNGRKWSEQAKKAFASECEVVWRCATGRNLASECKRDYLANCPLNWTETKPGICSAPRDFARSCKKEINVSNWAAREKQNFAASCGVKWPCGVAPKGLKFL